MLDTQSQTHPSADKALRLPQLCIKLPTDHFLMRPMFDMYNYRDE